MSIRCLSAGHESCRVIVGNGRAIPGQWAKEIKEEEYYCREMAAGRFFRQVTLPAEAQADKAEASYEHGMLRLRLPLAQVAKESRIKVKAAGAK